MRRIAIMAAGFLLTGAGSPAAEFHVAPGGDDGNPGTAERPFATLVRARDAARWVERPADGGQTVEIVLHDGTWRLAEPLDLDPRDSRTTWRAAAGAKPAISGGRIIHGLKAGADGLWTAAIPEARDGKWAFNELFVNGRRATRARFPNAGYLRIDKPGGDNRTGFTYAGKDLAGLEGLAGAQLVFLHDWSISRVRIASVDHAARTVTLAGAVGAKAAFFRMTGFEPHPRYFLEDAAGLLDAAGEWHLDQATGVLRYRPRPGEKIESAEVVAPRLRRLVRIHGRPGEGEGGLALDIRFDGLTFEHCLFVPAGWRYAGIQAGFHESGVKQGRGAMAAAIDWVGVRGGTMHGCTIRHVGGSGVRFHASCADSGAARSTVADAGGNGIMLGSEGKLSPAAPAKGLFASRNTVRDCGRRYFGCVGIWVGIADAARVSFNEVSGMPYTGVSVGWSWNTNETGCRDNRIESNHIHHVMETLSDGGGIYTLRRQGGTIVRGNLIHDIPPNAGRTESNGMFIDEGSSLLTIEGNAIYGVARSPIRFHRARRDTVRGNVLVSSPGVPTFRYNSTDPRTMTFAGNRELGEAVRGAAPPDWLVAARRRSGPEAAD